MQELPEESIEKLSRVTKLLSTQRTLPAKLESVVAIVKRTIPHCHAAGITLLIDGEPTTSAVTDRLAVEIDLVQYQTGEGPCLGAITDSNLIRIDVLERDGRFSRFAPGALDLEVNSVLSVPLVARGRTVGALNMYSRLPDAFDAQCEEAVQPMADHAAEAISTSPLYAYSLDMVEGLVETLESQALIAQATGVIMATEERTSDEALDRLRTVALTSGESMRTVADRVLKGRPRG
ncbi:MAG: GAF and ANTAR domain-containing protein [Actinomycetota bacterium]|nr:GAF and ANTAR domain-containing protein [Actinomycetota bacterium]